VDEIPEGESVTTGKFPVNQNPIVVLFNSGSFARKYEQLCTDLSYGYRISSAGVDVLTNQMVRGATLELGSRKFRVNLIVMPGLVLYVIIGINWIKDWRAVIDTGVEYLPLRIPRVRVLFRYHCPEEQTL
jgi:hypothetical protein